MRSSVYIASLCLSAAACGPEPKPPVYAPAPVSTAEAKAAVPINTPRMLPDDVDLEISVAPQPSTSAVVRVTLGARGDGIQVWQSPNVIDFEGEPEARDTIGPIEATVDTTGGKTVVTLERAPTGTVWVTYEVRGKDVYSGDPPPVLVKEDRFAAAGEAMIVIPAAFEERTVRGTLRVGREEIGDGDSTAGATSFGVGSKVNASARGADLRGSYFVAGRWMGQGRFRGPEGNDNAAWLGYTLFDPRPGFADMAGVRTALRQLFKEADSDELTILFLSDQRAPGEFMVSRRPRSVVAWVSARDAWTAPLRIAVATAVVHGWIGTRLWVGPSDPEREAEAYWFTEGIARNLARDLLFRYGLISPIEATEEVEGLASVLATSPRGAESNEALRKDPKGALPVLVARGALYGLRTDAKLRAKTKNKRNLQEALHDLYLQAAEVKGPLPATAWTDVLARELGESERAAFHDLIETGKPLDLPSDGLGPCFRGVTRTYTAFDLGFEEQLTRESGTLAGLEKGGPAEKAGLRQGDTVTAIEIDRRAADGHVKVTVARDDKPVIITYRPAGKQGKGPGFERKRDVADDACTP